MTTDYIDTRCPACGHEKRITVDLAQKSGFSLDDLKRSRRLKCEKCRSVYSVTDPTEVKEKALLDFMRADEVDDYEGIFVLTD